MRHEVARDHDGRESASKLLRAHGPILVVLNRAAAMGPDVMVLCYGYGTPVASSNADKAGEAKHMEALCKLGVATAPSAYGDAFPVVHYALVHWAGAGRGDPMARNSTLAW